MSFKIILSLLGIILLGIFAALLLALSHQFAPSRVQSLPKFAFMERMVLKTSDGLDIVADYYPPKTQSPRGALLVHMMPADRTSWRSFAPQLVGKGYHVLAIDLRGHGESTGGPNGYQRFSDQDTQNSIHDLEAGVMFLESRGVKPEHLILVGASIGANLCLWYEADHPDARQAALLSPGLNYRGITAEPLVEKLRAGQRVLLVSSEDDQRSDGSDADMNRQLYGLVPSGVDKQLLIYKHAGHGTDMFGKEQPDLTGEILTWLK